VFSPTRPSYRSVRQAFLAAHRGVPVPFRRSPPAVRPPAIHPDPNPVFGSKLLHENHPRLQSPTLHVYGACSRRRIEPWMGASRVCPSARWALVARSSAARRIWHRFPRPIPLPSSPSSRGRFGEALRRWLGKARAVPLAASLQQHADGGYAAPHDALLRPFMPGPSFVSIENRRAQTPIEDLQGGPAHPATTHAASGQPSNRSAVGAAAHPAKAERCALVWPVLIYLPSVVPRRAWPCFPRRLALALRGGSPSAFPAPNTPKPACLPRRKLSPAMPIAGPLLQAWNRVP